MKEIRWNKLKSERLKLVRGVSFEELLSAEFIKKKEHPGRKAQNIMLFKYCGYVWVIPFVESSDHIFLKTLYPSRKHTKLFRKGLL